ASSETSGPDAVNGSLDGDASSFDAATTDAPIADGPLDATPEAHPDGPADDGPSSGLGGTIEKGPFALGSTVTISEIDASGKTTGRVFSAQTTDGLGRFSEP